MTINDPISHFSEANGDVEPEPSMVLPIPTDGMQLTMDGEKGRAWDAWEKGGLQTDLMDFPFFLALNQWNPHEIPLKKSTSCGFLDGSGVNIVGQGSRDPRETW